MNRTNKKSSNRVIGSVIGQLFRLFLFIFGFIPIVLWLILEMIDGDNRKEISSNRGKSRQKGVVARNKEEYRGKIRKKVEGLKDSSISGGKALKSKVKGKLPKRTGVNSRINDSSTVATKNLRQKRILSLIGRKGSVAMSDVKALFPGVNVRTVRRDLDVLVKKGLVTKEGTTRSTVYKSKS